MPSNAAERPACERPPWHPNCYWPNCKCGKKESAAATGHKLVLEIEVPDFYVDGTTEQACEEFDCQVVDIVLDEWMRADVGLTFVSIPGEKEMNSDFEVHAMNGRIVGARIEPVKP